MLDVSPFPFPVSRSLIAAARPHGRRLPGPARGRRSAALARRQVGRLHPDPVLAQGEPRYHPHLAGRRGGRHDAPAHCGPWLGPPAPLVARRAHPGLRLDAGERAAAVAVTGGRGRGGGPGAEARRVWSLADGVSDPVWLPDGTGVLVTSDIKWPADQEIDRRNGDYPTEARIWTELLWRHWDDWRAGKRQHLFLVTVADGAARDLTPVDHDVPTIATSGDGDVAVAPDGKEIAVALHGDSSVADNTNVDIYLITRDGGGGT